MAPVTGPGGVEPLRFEWDEKKAAANLSKHGVSFVDAVTGCYDPLAATFADPDHSIGEERFVTVGYSLAGRLLVVSHRDQDDCVRVISAREATRKERMRHESGD